MNNGKLKEHLLIITIAREIYLNNAEYYIHVSTVINLICWGTVQMKKNCNTKTLISFAQ